MVQAPSPKEPDGRDTLHGGPALPVAPPRAVEVATVVGNVGTLVSPVAVLLHPPRRTPARVPDAVLHETTFLAVLPLDDVVTEVSVQGTVATTVCAGLAVVGDVGDGGVPDDDHRRLRLVLGERTSVEAVLDVGDFSERHRRQSLGTTFPSPPSLGISVEN